MANNPELGGGLESELHSFATKISLDGLWQSDVEQRVSAYRTASIAGYDYRTIEVVFEASKIMIAIGSVALKTEYCLKIRDSQDQMIIDELPGFVKEELSESYFSGLKSNEDVVSFGYDSQDFEADESAGSGGSEVDLDDFYDDSIRFKFERSLEYVFDGDGQLESCVQAESYKSLESDDEEVIFQNSAMLPIDGLVGVPSVVDLSLWGKNFDVKGGTLDDRKLSTLGDDIGFLEVVKLYSVSEEAHSEAKEGHQRSALALIAFLQYKSTSSDIINLL